MGRPYVFSMLGKYDAGPFGFEPSAGGSER
jgi:hypothetical protein